MRNSSGDVAIFFGNLLEIRGIRVIRAYLASIWRYLSSHAENTEKLFNRYSKRWVANGYYAGIVAHRRSPSLNR